jgi:Ca2+:H+ antiporter
MFRETVARFMAGMCLLKHPVVCEHATERPRFPLYYRGMTLSKFSLVFHVLGPVIAVVLVVVFWSSPPDLFGVLFLTVVLAGGVMSSVHYVEIVAAHVGRVWGAIVLAIAVTVIEVGLILAIMLSAGPTAATLGRDTVFAAVMITCNGIIGFSVVAATLRSSTSSFNSEGSGAALGAIATIATLGLVLPSFLKGSSGPTFTQPQLVFVAFVALSIYALFLWVLTVRNREHFEDVESPPTEALHLPPTTATFRWSIVLLVVSLGAIVGLAKVLAPSIETVVRGAGLPLTLVAVILALVILMPEGISAVRFARRGNLQSSFNIGYGSALASIGLTIPALAIFSLVLDVDLQFGLGASEIVLFFLTLVVSTVTVASHRVTLFQGGLHVVIFFSFLFLAVSP